VGIKVRIYRVKDEGITEEEKLLQHKDSGETISES